MNKVKGLLYKDLIQSISVIILIIVITFIFTATGLAQVLSSFRGYVEEETGAVVSDFEAFQTGLLGSCFYIPYLAFFPTIMTISNAELDEKCNFDKFILSSGVDRKIVIKEKIGLGFIFSTIPFIGCLLFNFGILIPQNPEVTVIHSLLLTLISLGNFLICIPFSECMVVFFGSFKAKQFGILIDLIIMLLECGIIILFAFFGLNNYLIGSVIAIGYLILSIILFILFYKIALKKYQLKDF